MLDLVLMLWIYWLSVYLSFSYWELINIKGTRMEVMRSGVLTAVIMKIMIFWVGTSYSVVGTYRQFGRICIPDFMAPCIFLTF